ncbi:hypothetical protein J7U46_05625 [Pelomonas sp. V22]|uniref:secretin N-terminal domain-containing protein n=1 Tax=Pelomonas sp. V22 TaxID=2822139 RepID=UPI0024A9AA4E|nr:secretin N-terminal domain-containing protein [Pelomonas sp. V22]MDI4632517.1 hypothetical protein [Pelomonas sp. V22]
MKSPLRPLAPKRLAVPSLLTLLLGGCAIQPSSLPGPVEFKHSPKADGSLSATKIAAQATSTGITAMPTPPAAVPSREEAQPAGGTLQGDDEEVSIAIEQTPLPMFLQILYGNVLKRAYSLDPAVTSRTDPVTFKTSRPLTKRRMLSVATSLLRTYGLSVVDFDGLIRVTPEANASNPSTRVQLGKSVPEGSDPFRPAFQYVELDTVRPAEMSQWLRQILGTKVTLQEDVARNAFLLSGTQADLRTALDLIESFDQPRMRGRIARRITPAYASATDLSNRLVEVLTAQGYAVTNSGSTGSAAVVVMPIPAISSVLVFAGSNAVMTHVEQWAKELDRAPTGASSNALFTYPVKYADAQELAKTLGELLGGSSAQATGTAGAATQRAYGRVVVNNATNTLIFKGSTAEEQQQIKDLLRDLDRPTKSAMIEVVVAEVQRGALESLGVQWTLNKSGVGVPTQSAKIGGNGLNLAYINGAGQVLGALDALATNSQARILSNPKVLARNGETATIQVGNEVPIITSQQTTGVTSGFPGAGSSQQVGVLNQVQYKQTGVILKVRPVINSGNRLDLEVSQEVSSAATTQTGVSASPTISTRRIETKLSLRDGSTVLLGGLISKDESDSTSGVPLLKDIPGIGALFRSQSANAKQTELLVMITPYVVNDDYEAEEITQAIQATFGDWAKDLKTARVAKEPIAAPSASEARDSTPAQPQQAQPAKPAQEPAPGKKPGTAPGPVDDGVITSRPTQTLPATPTPGSSGSTEAGKPQDKPGTEAPAAAGKPLPAGASGKVVTDPKVLEEIQKLLGKPKQ